MRSIALALLLLTAASCASGSRQAGAPPAAAAPAGAQQATAAQLDAILAGGQRSAANRARDQYRHPRETLLFFGIRPDMRVVEVWPESGWYTEIIAPLVNERGKYYAAQPQPDPRSVYAARM